jgi:hypothetical protein
MDIQEQYNELAYYTLAHPDPAFIHQHLVDAFGAQNAEEGMKPIGLMFALAGLYLAVEKGYTGKQVQDAHIEMAKKRKDWPAIPLPVFRGDITAADVLAVPPGPDRDRMFLAWCKSVWDAYTDSQQQVRDVVKDILGV